MDTAIPTEERDVVRRLAGRVAEIAARPVHAETAALWKAGNDLKPVRPMVYVYQLPWRELPLFGDGGPSCQHPVTREIEQRLAEIIFRWERLPVDMVVEPFYAVQYVVQSTGVGMEEIKSEIPHDADGGMTAKHYDCQIKELADIEKIRPPVLTYDADATAAKAAVVGGLIGDLLPVRTVGVTHHNYAPWDRLAEWWNPQEVLMALAMDPDMVHAAMERLCTAYMSELDQLEGMGLLSLGTGNFVVGQGGMGFTGDLPGAGAEPQPARLADQWGGAMAQIFSEVSPDMHEEYALAYESRFLRRFGMTYYGCCEPLDRKVDICMKHIPNLRKISMSPWTDPVRGAEAVGGRLVYSCKTNPAFLATDGHWNRKSAEAEIRGVLEANRGCSVEVILKDVSTVRFEPERLYEWCAMAMDLAREAG